MADPRYTETDQLALAAGAAAGIVRPSSFGALPSLEDVPLALATLEARLQRVELILGLDQDYG